MTLTRFNTALIVGAGSGLSASLARVLAKEGIKVALAARSTGDLDALVKETGARAYACDASQRADVGKLFSPISTRISARPRSSSTTRATASAARSSSSIRSRSRSRSPSPPTAPFWWRSRPRAACCRTARRHRLQRRLRRREGLRAVRAVRHGQVCAARPGAEHGARTASARHPRGACRDRRRHQERAPAEPPTSPPACSTRTRSPPAICTSSINRTVHGLGDRGAAVGGEILSASNIVRKTGG